MTTIYERFSDRARKVLQLANQEALRFGHKYIGTEHILLVIVKEGTGVAANVLKNLDIDLRKIRIETEKLLTQGPPNVFSGKAPLTPNAKRVMELAIKEANGLSHNYVGTEHLLLALMGLGEGAAFNVLLALGVKVETTRAAVLELLKAEPTGEMGVSQSACESSVVGVLLEARTAIDRALTMLYGIQVKNVSWSVQVPIKKEGE